MAFALMGVWCFSVAPKRAMVFIPMGSGVSPSPRRGSDMSAQGNALGKGDSKNRKP